MAPHGPAPASPLRVLILGGTSEASSLLRALDGDRRFAPTLSLAGRTAKPVLPDIPVRIGGFGGEAGLARVLEESPFDVVVDATHPFAARMSAHARVAAAMARRPLLRLTRPPWIARDGDRWITASDMPGAAERLGIVPRRVFLTVGRQELAPFAARPWHHYVIRSVDPPGIAATPPGAAVITGRGPFDLNNEMALLRDHAIDVVVTKNSGGTATQAKLDAARALNIPVVMVKRPDEIAAAETVTSSADAVGWLVHRYATATTPRGV